MTIYKTDGGGVALDRLIRPALWVFLAILVVVPSLLILSFNQVNQRAAVFELKAANGLALALAGKPDQMIVDAFGAAGFENARLATASELANPQTNQGGLVPIYAADGRQQGGITFTFYRPAAKVFVSTVGYKAPIALSGLLFLAIYVVRISRRARALDIQRVAAQKTDATDGLHLLANRKHFDEKLVTALRSAYASKLPLAVYFVDIDHLKRTNEAYGHGVGDALIRQTGDMLQMVAEPSDVVARLVGDQFAVIKLNPGSTAAAMAFAHEIVQELSTDLMIEGLSVRTSASVGIALTTGNNSVDAGELCRNAEMALFAAKRAGRNRATLYKEPEISPAKDTADQHAEFA